MQDIDLMLELGKELHNLLWDDSGPTDRHGNADNGRSCRDHAFILGIALRCNGSEVAMQHGEAMFVGGPAGANSPRGTLLQVHFHGWLVDNEQRITDLSVKLKANALVPDPVPPAG